MRLATRTAQSTAYDPIPLAWPDITPPASSASTGFVQPHSFMLAARRPAAGFRHGDQRGSVDDKPARECAAVAKAGLRLGSPRWRTRSSTRSPSSASSISSCPRRPSASGTQFAPHAAMEPNSARPAWLVRRGALPIVISLRECVRSPAGRSAQERQIGHLRRSCPSLVCAKTVLNHHDGEASTSGPSGVPSQVHSVISREYPRLCGKRGSFPLGCPACNRC